MEFTKKIRTTIRKVDPVMLLGDKCIFCDSTNTIVRSSRIRKLQDLGTPSERVEVHLKVPRIMCKDCKAEFQLHHPAYPPKFEYSQAVVEYSLTRYHFKNTSGNIISEDLKLLHQVDAPEATIYSWLKEHSPEFIKAKLEKEPNQDFSHIKSITIDGSYVSTGKDIIGKKKDVESLSVTKLKNGDYLLMWWE